ncbi:MAG: class I adenylate-forming enzyme family protein [Acidimicrobiales bacterium]
MLAETVREAARRFGDRPAYVAARTDASGYEGWSVSYAELDRLSDELVAGLAERGIGPGDVVALALPAVPEYPVAYAALAKLGAVTAGVNVRLAPAERDAVLAAARPTLVLASPEAAPAPGVGWDVAVVDPADGCSGVFDDLRPRTGRRPSMTSTTGSDDDPVALVFTSGTTGAPKGAAFANRQLRAITAVDVGETWGGGGPSIAASAPAHLGFMTKLPGNLRRGATQHLLPSWRAEDALRLTAQHGMGAVGGVPAQVTLMLRHPDFDRYDLSAVQAVVMGGGPATPALIREARERFGAVVMVRYSCTEAGIGVGTAATDPPEDAEDTVGHPLPGVDLVVLDVGGGRDHQPGEAGGTAAAERPVEAGGVGAIGLRSAAVMSGYWHDPEATAAAFTADGFVRTGDLGFVDDRGRLHLRGRSTERYVRGGYNVHPFEVEAVLADHPAVKAVAVVPRPDDVMGEVGVAVVVAAADARRPSLADLRRHADGRLARHKLPEDLVVVDALPLTPADKVDRRALADLAGAAS